MITKIQYTDQVDRQTKLITNADKILIEEDNLIEGNFLIFTDQRVEGTTLEEVQKNKISQITDLYNQHLTNGFISNAYNYGYAPSDILKFLQLDTLINKNMATFPVTVHTKDNKDIQLTQAQYTQLIVDMAIFAQAADKKFHDYINQVNACQNISDVNGIIVTF